jgi:hypothetical protein
LGGETPVVVDTAGTEHFYDRSDHSTYRIIRQEGDFNVVKIEPVVADEGVDGNDKMPQLPVFPYERRRAANGHLEIVNSNEAKIVYDLSSDTETDDEPNAEKETTNKNLGKKAKGNVGKETKGGNKVRDALSATATKRGSQSE